jgi:hypothetical protein
VERLDERRRLVTHRPSPTDRPSTLRPLHAGGRRRNAPASTALRPRTPVTKLE